MLSTCVISAVQSSPTRVDKCEQNMVSASRQLLVLSNGELKVGVEYRAVSAIAEEDGDGGAEGEPSDYEAAIAAAARDARR